jgi:hypothetical protein
MSLLVTGVGALVLFYCWRYFRDDEPGLGRFAATLAGFAGAIGLVAADDLILLYVFWDSPRSSRTCSSATSRFERDTYALSLVLCVALLSFVGSVSVARFVSRRPE